MKSLTRWVRRLAIGGALVSTGGAALAGSAEDWAKMKTISPQGYECGRVSEPPKIDGDLYDAAWRDAPWTVEFSDIEGPTKAKPPLVTRAKMVWDAENLYIGADLEEPNVWATINDHDAVIFQDNDFEVFIDPNGDNHDYFELELNALNTTWDLFLPKPYKDGGGAENKFEFAGLTTAVKVQGTLNDPSDKDRGWSVEIAIPWKSMAKHAGCATPPAPGDQWRIDFSRVEWATEIANGKTKKIANRREDNWIWSPPGIVDMHRPERWGFVRFSGEAPGKTKFAADGSLAARDRLMEVYHRQRSHFDAHKQYAKSLQELGMDGDGLEVSLEAKEGGFTATTAAQGRYWQVRQDSKLVALADAQPEAASDGKTASDKSSANAESGNALEAALAKAGKNRAQLQKALDDCPADQREGMVFLIENMPQRDLTSLTTEFLLDNVKLSYKAWQESPWKDKLPKEIFLNNVLPYANINERRDAWRADFRERFLPLVKDCQTPGLAAARMNQKLFKLVNVKYSTGRPKADQSPYESIKASTASCTGLSILLIDACRAVGVPARFAGTPLWTDNSGNHSWVEVWDDGWHITGAAEPSGDKLDAVWFMGRASAAKRDAPLNAIYAVSYRKTPLHFPLVWDRSIDYVWAVNVTDRYAGRGKKPPEGTVTAMFRVLDRAGGKRQRAAMKITDAAGKTLFDGKTNDEGFDANDHTTVFLPTGAYTAAIEAGGKSRTEKFNVEKPDTTFTFTLDAK